jgi:hypothetical protein
VIFESESKLLSIEFGAFFDCSSLSAICIPSSVIDLGRHCFGNCLSLSTVTFEAGSKLSKIDKSVFSGCPSLVSFLCLTEGCFPQPD